ncbi:MAG TPA: hypothetical protein VGQ02_10850 [Candidatus Limnocylindrales bacterium]|nr:hypothetical protein [Candidatus Limnocylindrales bacterium]
MNVQRLPVKKRAAKRPPTRTVEVGIAEGDFEGWRATLKVDFPAKLLEEFESGSAQRVINALQRLVVDHNFPDAEGEVAATLMDVDPYTGLVAIADAYLSAIRALPPR